jgi:hypothetical protein
MRNKGKTPGLIKKKLDEQCQDDFLPRDLSSGNGTRLLSSMLWGKAKKGTLMFIPSPYLLYKESSWCRDLFFPTPIINWSDLTEITYLIYYELQQSKVISADVGVTFLNYLDAYSCLKISLERNIEEWIYTTQAISKSTEDGILESGGLLVAEPQQYALVLDKKRYYNTRRRKNLYLVKLLTNVGIGWVVI